MKPTVRVDILSLMFWLHYPYKELPSCFMDIMTSDPTDTKYPRYVLQFRTSKKPGSVLSKVKSILFL